MASYFVGDRVHVDMPGDVEGIPVVDEFGSETCVLPEEFDRNGRPEADIMRWQPEPESVSRLARTGMGGAEFFIDPTVDGGMIGMRSYEPRPAAPTEPRDYPEAPYLVN